ncbi:MAG: undecaprenyldiphospho-muramoylpentapeptide beta-N-acetylglucosaminyltransferase [Acidimicrobiales bacterium]|nr:undecaprenyldiphospho-muramoylpentapeptide beta-N-acetylglucosaminyltransferase [Acidimicrobiales bacterium]
MTGFPAPPSPDPDRAWAVLAGGGTAGHVLPGLAIARALSARGRGPLHLVGSRRGVEVGLVPEAGYALTVLPGRGIQRRLTVANASAVAGLLAAAVQALVLIRRLRPAVVVSLGGYASVPCALAAVFWRVPIVVAEQNAVPGAANRLVARFARVSAVSFPGTALPRAVVTGNPVRAEVLAVDRSAQRADARRWLGLPDDRVVVLAFGGSLGAGRINEAVVALCGRWLGRHDVAVRHVTGARNWPPAGPRPDPPPGGLVYQAVPYEDDMARAYAAADLVVARAGATTVAELAVVGMPAVLVPLPGAPGDHQTANARWLERAGAAVVVPDDACSGARLAEELEAVLARPGHLAAMAASAGAVARPDAAERVADLVEAAARG